MITMTIEIETATEAKEDEVNENTGELVAPLREASYVG